jgi:hypothetical protein
MQDVSRLSQDLDRLLREPRLLLASLPREGGRRRGGGAAHVKGQPRQHHFFQIPTISSVHPNESQIPNATALVW